MVEVDGFPCFDSERVRMRSMARWWRSRSGGQRLATQGLIEDLLQETLRSEGGAMRRRDEGGSSEASMMRVKLHGGLGHFRRRTARSRRGRVDNVGQRTSSATGVGVEAEAGLRRCGRRKLVQEMYSGSKKRWPCVAAIRPCRRGNPGGLRGVRKGAEVVIEPPGDFGRGEYLKSTMAFSTPVKSASLKRAPARWTRPQNS